MKKKDKNSIRFKTEIQAKRFLKQLQSIHSKYSITNYFREGKVVYRY